MKAKLVFAVVAALCVTTTNVYGDIFDATHRGWWQQSGTSNNSSTPANERNYGSANFSSNQFTNYLAFQRSDWAGSWVVSGNLLIDSSFVGTPGATYTLRDYTGTFAALTTGTGNPSIYTDLATGTVYGSGTINLSATNTIALNAAAINELQNGSGTHFVMGGWMNSNQTAFFNTDATHFTRLDLVLQENTAPVADPGGPYNTDPLVNLFLDGSASFDPDEALGDSIVSWEWDVNGDAIYDFTGETYDATWAELVSAGIMAGNSYNLALRVTDEMGAQHVATTLLTVSGVPEPATCVIWALAGGSCGLASYRRRRKKNS